MYPYAKVGLANYRAVAASAIFGFAMAVFLGLLFHRFLGVWLTSVAALYAVQVVIALFRWNSEPTARRQYAVLLALIILYGGVAFFGVDRLIAGYHVWRGECPGWLYVAFSCDLPARSIG